MAIKWNANRFLPTNRFHSRRVNENFMINGEFRLTASFSAWSKLMKSNYKQTYMLVTKVFRDASLEFMMLGVFESFVTYLQHILKKKGFLIELVIVQRST